MARPLRPGLFSLLLLAQACTGAEVVKPPEPEVVAPANPELPALDVAALQAGAEKDALVPSPVETQKALEAAGVATKLATLIPNHDFDFKNAGIDHAAVRTGVVLADLLLATKDGKKEDLVLRLGKIDEGMTQLGGGADITATLKDYQERIQADAVQRDDLLKEFDELSGVVIPELEFNGQDRVVPLIEAGSWLEGANLVARAIKAAPDRTAGEKLLKAPSVVEYFLKYVRSDNAAKAPEVVTKKLEESLGTLKALSEKSEPLTDADIDTVIRVTDEVLNLL
jgi:hypothetical protein